ncbi:xanthine dehydrogenase family protein molybdopterin-binding subunit [Kibdelosporangium aridum]|uniref:xanthine dehydrogenase family protein molybdopterin-binding subunit n=1 Tax=Kibdelosporangium aridum TaxID=2030 RepID=UPI0035EA0605
MFCRRARCVDLATRLARSPLSALWTNWPRNCGSIRSICGCATNPRSVRCPVCRSAAATWWAACARAHAGSAGPNGICGLAGRREGDLLVGTGMAAVSFLTLALPSTATITAEKDGTYTVSIGASDIGTGARTALVSIAADAMRVKPEKIHIRIADSDFGNAWAASGSLGQASWSWAVTSAAKKLREQLATRPPLPVTVTADTTAETSAMPHKERQSHSAIFAEVIVDPATGEVGVRRLLGMFGIGRVVNPLTARSQAIGGMIMGLSLALHEESVRDPHSGRHINADFAGYHISAHADVPDIEADFVPDHEPDIASGIKGVGELGTCGTAAAIANAVWHATGRRHRTLPIRLDRVLEDRVPQ